ncbi:MAG: PPE domain-containing protein [Mycobacteriaceae bacterium]|nr:PPE domain-containing protein [Mycobacteriaceae bacterium]
MDFAMLPPEINSARIYAGPGPGPLLTAAQSWAGLATELSTAANSYQSALAGLTTESWLGPSATAMASAATSYVAWLRTTAAQAEETAVQAEAGAAAYAAAVASSVPPQEVIANRTLLMQLLATNIFGHHATAIAAAEAQYTEMWAQDAAAMYNYAGSAASATALTSFTPPGPITNPAAQAFSVVPDTLQSLAAAGPALAVDPLIALSTLASLITIFIDLPAGIATLLVDTPLTPLTAVALPYDIISTLTGLNTDEIVSGWAGQEAWPGTGTRPPTEFPAIITHPGPVSASAAAGLGEATKVGALSVPATWTIATPAVRPVSALLPALPAAGGAATVGGAGEIGVGGLLGELALAGMAGGALAGSRGISSNRSSAKTRPAKPVRVRAEGTSSSGPAVADAEHQPAQDTPRTVVTGVAAELREFAKLRDEGILTEEEFTEQKNRLLGR